MPIQEDFEKQGAWIFKWRSYLPLLMFIIGIIAIVDLKNTQFTKYDTIIEIICLLVSGFGLTLRILTIGYTPAGTSGRNTKNQVADHLNTTGMYSILRHPLYFGNFFIILGVVLFTRHIWVLFSYWLIYFLYYERIIFTEEAFLRKKYGAEFIAWANKTPIIFPRFKNYQKPELPFSLKNIIRREYQTFFAMICSLFAMEVISDLIIRHQFKLDTGWLVIMSVSSLFYIVTRYLAKKTKLLKTPGR
ncbi:MAG TPA: isoprenylcysteine carboxylmethyltransferase family protein [Candidatus Cloacimonas sp.]|nr:MAG: Isoprenylcysteine carboxyl methyltransferase (ICMT) family protein [Candidatus Cloacimonetes bacterium ADurb.Bin089]HPB18379.1 isoprenylcysteine carboxylmethyltransferase family protein [Candidatus Cloacimonas sp.]HQO17596.1 isoprenylcysteine carboxylmethyltransferase family protein [Candidatus Cloacimonas sp.]